MSRLFKPTMTSEQEEHCRSWIAKLRSGEYEQIMGSFKEADKFCCVLGVAWDMVHPDFEPGSDDFPQDVRDYFGLEDELGDLIFQNDDLTELNDCGVPFDELATIIEEELNEIMKPA